MFKVNAYYCLSYCLVHFRLLLNKKCQKAYSTKKLIDPKQVVFMDFFPAFLKEEAYF